MPLILKELIVKARVQEGPKAEMTRNESKKEEIILEREAIIQEAVDQILEILEKEKER